MYMCVRARDKYGVRKHTYTYIRRKEQMLGVSVDLLKERASDPPVRECGCSLSE